MSIIKNTWSETHPGVKTALVVALAGMGAFLVYRVVRQASLYIDQWQSRKEGNQALEEVAQLGLQGIFPTLTDANIEAMVNSLKSELDDTFVNDEVVMNVLYKVQNKADWAKLKYRWGSQDLGDGAVTLSEALADRLYDSSKESLNQIYIAKGIGAIV